MKIALHFELELGEAETDAQIAVMRALATIPPHRRHCRIYMGIINSSGLPRGKSFEQLLIDLTANTTVSSIDVEDLRHVLLGNRLYVIVVDGLTIRQTTALHDRLSGHGTYVGVIGLDERVGKHRALYHLPATYRIIGQELRVQHTFEALDEDGDPEAWYERIATWNNRHILGWSH